MKQQIIRLLLFFCKTEYFDTLDRIGLKHRIMFKRLFDRTHILNISVLPPTHLNCRCQILPVEL